jgi:hypothetical protein
MYANDFLIRIARPLYERSQSDPNCEELVWSATVSLNQIPDYIASDRLPFPIDQDMQRSCSTKLRGNDPHLNNLNLVANGLKHGVKLKKTAAVVDSHSFKNDFLSISDVLAEPNFFFSWVVEINGQTCSIGPLLDRAIKHWSTELGI